ncbi:MAG: T9SS type A sorting domain-containing protein, partial [candidate division KSB1 bacterium]|nr:T9SS type A sorting domain-containing protein [candidate division KSB1 bacterium]
EDLRVGDFRPIGLQVEGGPQTVQGVRVSPGRGWEASTRKEFEVQPDGTVPGIGELSQFLQGSDKAAMGREAIFHTRFAQEIGFAVAVGSVSSWQPGRLQIFLDDNKTPLVNETPQPPQRFEIRVPAGEHRIRVFNAGVDWLTIDYFEFSGLPISAATGYALSNGETAYVWIYDRDYHAGASPHAALIGVIVTLPELAGEFEVEQWNTITGKRIGTFKVSDKRSISIPLADFAVDTALKLHKTGTSVSNEISPTCFRLYPPYPNPFNGSMTLRFELEQSERMRISVLNLLGDEVQKLLDERLGAGTHCLYWSAEGFPSGVYWIKFQTAGQVQIVKAALLK